MTYSHFATDAHKDAEQANLDRLGHRTALESASSRRADAAVDARSSGRGAGEPAVILPVWCDACNKVVEWNSFRRHCLSFGHKSARLNGMMDATCAADLLTVRLDSNRRCALCGLDYTGSVVAMQHLVRMRLLRTVLVLSLEISRAC